jgi:hypothetical protein
MFDHPGYVTAAQHLRPSRAHVVASWVAPLRRGSPDPNTGCTRPYSASSWCCSTTGQWPALRLKNYL